ncbi:hypothetical protein N7490_011486 [Penicillium lividum]|nr:hypothetical protein N7490_011486 [Penicillium lividum]
MVRLSTILCGALAYGIIDPCFAAKDETKTVLTTPIMHQLEEEGFNMTLNLGVINADYAGAYTNNSLDLSKRTGITSVLTIVKKAAEIIKVGKDVIDIVDFVAGVMKTKSNSDSCTVTKGTDTGDSETYGYAYRATTTGDNCDTTAELKTLISAVTTCFNNMNEHGCTLCCCQFDHGGTWRGNLQMSADPTSYPATDAVC